VIGSLAAGALVGFGVLLVVRAAFPGREPLAAAVARLAGVRVAEPESIAPVGHWGGRIGGPLAEAAASAGITFGSMRRDLRLVGRSIESHLATKVGAAAFLALLAPATAGVMALGGVAVPAVATVWVAIGLAVGGFFLPDALARAEAVERRAEFRHTIGSFLDLVVIVLAAGGGVQSALNLAASTGEGWAYDQLRRTLEAARLSRRSPWDALGRLGDELGVTELEELAASMELAGTEGARVRDSLVAKARSIRTHELAESEAEAGVATERMSFPVALLAFGFFALIGYPAVSAVLHGI